MAKVDKSKGSISWVNDFARDIERFGEDKLDGVETDEELKRLAEVLEHFERCYAKYKGEEFDMEGRETEEEYRYYLEGALTTNTKGVLRSVEGRLLSMTDAFRAGELDPLMFPDPSDIEKEEPVKADSVPTAGMKKTFEFDGKEYSLSIGAYPSHPMVMFIQVKDSNGEAYDTVTHNLGSNYYTNPFAECGACAVYESLVPMGCTFLNGNTASDEQKEMQNKVIEVLGGEPYRKRGERVVWYGGYDFQIPYSLYQFDMEKLKEYDPKGFAEYQQAWTEQMGKEQAEGTKWSEWRREEYGDEEDDDGDFGDE